MYYFSLVGHLEKYIAYLQPQEKLFPVYGTQRIEAQRRAQIYRHPSLLKVNGDGLSALRPHTAQANETIVVTAVDVALLASAASAVVNDRLDDDAVTRSDVFDVVANFFYLTAKLMSDN